MIPFTISIAIRNGKWEMIHGLANPDDIVASHSQLRALTCRFGHSILGVRIQDQKCVIKRYIVIMITFESYFAANDMAFTSRTVLQGSNKTQFGSVERFLSVYEERTSKKDVES
jgi:hypothetical protein